MEELALVKFEVEETNESNKEMVARLRNQLKETEEELYAMHQIKEKKEEKEEKAREKERSEASNIVPSDLAFSEITANNANLFRETLKGIRDYIGTLDSRKAEARKLLLRT
jgi:hypothetical protein